MFKWPAILPFTAALLCLTTVVDAATTIDVGNYLLLPNTPGQVIQLPITGTDLAPGLDLAVQVGDGGPELAAFDLPPGTPGPTIGQIDFASGTIFSVPGATQFTPAGNLPQVWFTNVVLGASPSEVTTNGVLANLTIDTTNFSGGSFALLLKNVVAALSPPNGISTDLTSQVPHLTINNGSITIIPSMAYWQGGVSGAWSANSAGQTNWRTDATGATDTHTGPGVASDVFFATTSGAMNLTTSLDNDFSIKGLTFKSTATTPVMIAGSHTLTLGVDGLTVESGAATPTIGSSIALGASQIWSVAGSSPLLVNGAISLGSSTLTKTGGGTLRIGAAPKFGASSKLVVSAGSVQLNVASGAAMVDSGVTAMIAPGATLELANTISALSAGANRVDIWNSSQAASGGLLISGANQQVGAIDGSGNTIVSDGGSLIADSIRQNSLTIGAGAVVTIAPSDSSGNSLIDIGGQSFAGGLALDESLYEALASEHSLSSMDLLDSEFSFGGATVGDTNFAGNAVPEPSAIVLLGFGAVCLFVGYRRARNHG